MLRNASDCLAPVAYFCLSASFACFVCEKILQLFWAVGSCNGFFPRRVLVFVCVPNVDELVKYLGQGTVSPLFPISFSRSANLIRTQSLSNIQNFLFFFFLSLASAFPITFALASLFLFPFPFLPHFRSSFLSFSLSLSIFSLSHSFLLCRFLFFSFLRSSPLLFPLPPPSSPRIPTSFFYSLI